MPLLVFLVGAVAKRRGDFRLYALAHGLWHALSAAAIAQIVLSGGLPWEEWYSGANAAVSL